jgi:hypothetical protein
MSASQSEQLWLWEICRQQNGSRTRATQLLELVTVATRLKLVSWKHTERSSLPPWLDPPSITNSTENSWEVIPKIEFSWKHAQRLREGVQQELAHLINLGPVASYFYFKFYCALRFIQFNIRHHLEQSFVAEFQLSNLIG